MSKDSRWREGQPLLRAWSLVLHAHLRPSLPCGLGQVSANLRRPPPPPRGLSSLVFPGDWTARRTLGVWFPRPALTLRHPPPSTSFIFLWPHCRPCSPSEASSMFPSQGLHTCSILCSEIFFPQLSAWPVLSLHVFQQNSASQ